MSTAPTTIASINEASKEQSSLPKKDVAKAATVRVPGDPNYLAPRPITAKATPKKKAKPGPKPAGERPSKYLPTPRITFSKQLDILRAFAAASGPTGKVASNDDVAEIVKMNPSTISLANPFLASGGLITKTDGGYIPCPEVMSFLRAYEWSPDTAAQKLAPVLAKTWFAEELLSKLAFGPMTEDEAIQDLADAANAAPEYRGQLEILLDYLGAAGLIQRDGTQIKRGGTMTLAIGATASESPPTKTDSPPPAQETTPKPFMPSLFGTTEGAVNFHVSVRVDMSEFANWKPDRIAAFFGGMAQVLAAKAKVEPEK
jgi:hypothetical protein